MFRKIVSGTVLTLLLLSIVTSAFNIQSVSASGTIYIRADGSIDPPTASIHQEGDSYNLINNIYSGILVERSNIVVDGNGYTLQGDGSGLGFGLNGVDNVTIKNAEIKGFQYGISLVGADHNIISSNNIAYNVISGIRFETCCNNTITGNKITNNGGYGFESHDVSNYNIFFGNDITSNNNGLWLCTSSNNIVFGNNITNNNYGIHLYHFSRNNIIYENNISKNWQGIYFWFCFDNKFYHNKFINNTQHAGQMHGYGYSNFWDDDYPDGGNYWSDYTSLDSNFDGIGDTQYVIDSNNTDNYPLMGSFFDFTATPEYSVQTICNSTISSFQFNGTAIIFNVSGEDDTTGFCRICIPTALISPFKVLVDGIEIPYTLLPFSNGTHSYLYFTYLHSTHEIVITSLPTYILTITTTGMGTTTPVSGLHSYTTNSLIQVTAIPQTGYLFDHWELDGINKGSASPYTVLMDKDHTLKAVFSPIPPPKPVGGYSLQIEGYTTANPLSLYLALIAIFTINFTAIKRKTTRKTKKP